MNPFLPYALLLLSFPCPAGAASVNVTLSGVTAGSLNAACAGTPNPPSAQITLAVPNGQLNITYRFAGPTGALLASPAAATQSIVVSAQAFDVSTDGLVPAAKAAAIRKPAAQPGIAKPRKRWLLF